MKKLIMVMVAGLLATSTYSSTIKWGMNTGNLDAAKFAGATLYLVYDASAATASYLAALDGKTGTYSTSDITGKLVSGVTGTIDSTGYYNNTTGVTIVPSDIGLSANGFRNFYAVAISTDGKYLAYAKTDGKANISTSTMAATLAWNGTSGFATITTAAPEPTCMALLLMGVALVGLRRKAVR